MQTASLIGFRLHCNAAGAGPDYARKFTRPDVPSDAQRGGPVTALAFVLNLDNDPQRLRRSRNAGLRMGLRPKRRDSGQRSPQLSTTKSGDRMLRQSTPGPQRPRQREQRR